ncbi:MAG: T9SS type B sorting domain-containing protein [Cytophagales bacterium]|nr:T9SS type B sorting domain-containing protein [Cytophagales bacterium]
MGADHEVNYKMVILNYYKFVQILLIHMKKHFLFLFCILQGFNITFAQNLVPNGDFENYSSCPTGISQFDLAVPWNNPNQATPDYYNACYVDPFCPPICCPPFCPGASSVDVPDNLLGYQVARSGVGYAGFIAYEDFPCLLPPCPCPNPDTSPPWREYMQVQLTTPLAAGVTYCVQFYVSLADSVRYATDDIGLYFSNTAISDPDSGALPFTPQIVNTSGVITDAINWVLIDGTYIAAGGEAYIIIGNFKDDVNTTVVCVNSNAPFGNSFAYYYVEDVYIDTIGGCPSCVPPSTPGAITGPDTVCFGQTSVSYSISSVAGATSYNWTVPAGAAITAGQNTISITVDFGATSGNVCVTAGNGCGTSVASCYAISVNAAPTASITSSANISCNGASDGSATVTPSGGTPGYTYSWSPSGGSGATATGLAAGNYTVTVTDANNCSGTSAPVTITEPATLSASIISSSDITCNGFGDGTATVSSSGGTGAHSYLWLPSGGTNSTATGLGPGTYTVTVTDANLCQTIANTTIIEPDSLTASIISSSDITCNGFGDGAATVSSLGGTGIHSYSWSPSGGTNSTATGLGPGSYIVTVTDVNNCSTSANVTIAEPSAITLSLTSNPATCGNADGTATVAASGGAGSYTYLWAPPAQTTPIATGLASGNYTVIVTDSNSCSQSGFVIVTDLGGAAVSGMLISEVNCFGGNDGAATVSVSGGTLPYTYNWSPGGGNNDTATGLTAGTYVITVTDSAGCISTDTVLITQPDSLALTTNKLDATCDSSNAGAAIVLVSGGTTPYTYLWNDPSATDSFIVTGLAPGIYTVTVTDSAGCVDTAFAVINAPDTFITTITSINDVNCFGANDGNATVSLSGGTPADSGYVYLWNTTPAQTDSFAVNLPPGTWIFEGTDSLGCKTFAVVTINEPAELNYSLFLQNIGCTGGNCDGMIIVTPTGGTAPYSYLWNDPSVQTDSTADSLCAGAYMLIITDSKGCIDSVFAAVDSLGGGGAVSASTINAVSCFGSCDGVAAASPSGGIPPYTYLWDDPANQTNDTATGLCPGTYEVIVTDSAGCPFSDTVVISQPIQSSAVISGTDSICSNTSTTDSTITVNFTGNAPWSISYTNGVDTITINNISTTPFSFNSDTLNSNTTYTLTTLIDSSGCSGAISGSAAIIIRPKPVVNAGLGVSICFGDSTNLTAGGGIIYNWTPSISLTNDTVFNPIAFPVNTTTYYVTVYTANGCFDTESVTVTVDPEVFTSVEPSSFCIGGSAIISAFPTTNSYWWAEENTPIDTISTSSALVVNPAITTNYLVTSSKGACQRTDTVTVVVNQLPAADAGPDTTICKGESVQLQASGGTVYLWDPPSGLDNINVNNPVASPPSATIYFVTVTDSNGCINYDSVTVSLNAALCKDCELFILSAFSPNKDEVNDSWIIDGVVCLPNKVTIYNRWGDKVWEGENYNNKKDGIVWDGNNMNGRPLPDGTYFFLIELDNNNTLRKITVDKNGTKEEYTTESPVINGWVQILR